MAKLSGKYKGHNFHGDPLRFEVLAEYIYENYGKTIKYIADVAGGQGMLARVLNKRFNYKAEVIDPRGYSLNGVSNRQEEYSADLANYYDLVVGLHPDEATIEVAKSALMVPTIIIPCCNFWDREKTLGREALLEEIAIYYDQNHVKYKRVEFPFKTSKNVGLVSEPKNYSPKVY